MKDNKGIAIILDAFIALIFVLLVLSIYYGISHGKLSQTSRAEFKKLHYTSEDVLDVLNKEGVLDEVGEEWAEANGSSSSPHWGKARNLTKEYLDKLIPENMGYKVTIDQVPLYNSDNDPNSSRILEKEAETTTHSTRLLVGYGAGLPTRGHVARAFLTKIREKRTSQYAYFGGFVGQGNLTRIIELPSTLSKVQQVYIEVAAGGSFYLYVNNYSYGEFTPSGGAMAANIKQYLSSPWSHFTSGDNTIQIKFSSSDISEHYLGGGFIKVTYNTTEMETVKEKGEKYHYFPGIEGLVNLYSSLYVPGDLNSMEIYLKFLNNYTTYLTIGDQKVWENSGKNETQEILLEDENLTMLDYAELSLETVPMRLGVEGVSHLANVTGNADVILITDLSGSMEQCVDSNDDCSYPNQRIDLAVDLDKEFVDIILNTSGNRVGLVGFSETTSYESLTTDGTYLKTKIDQYSTGGGTCICCAINRAYNILNSESSSSRQKFIIMMSDGIPSHKCTSEGCEGTSVSGYFEGECYGCTYCCPADLEDGTGCSSPSSGCGYYWYEDYCERSCKCQCEMQNANYSSYRAHENLNATVDSIGFGPVASCPMGNWTLNAIADSGNGSYYASSNADELEEIYHALAQEIVNISYKAQTATITAEMAKSILYPESYLKFSYQPRNLSQFGQITLTQNTQKFNDTENCSGEIFVTEEATVVEAKITSYSAEHWTDFMSINGETVYSLRDGSFGNDYLILGDPYIVQIPEPSERLAPGQTNDGEIRTGNSPDESTGCSPDNRAIFTIRLDGRVGYGDAFSEKLGCRWKIQFEDNSYLEANILEDYAGQENCTYSADNVTYNQQDAIDDAIYRLLQKLDSNENEKLDVKFDSSMIEFHFSRAGGVRSLWGPITLKLVVWI